MSFPDFVDLCSDDEVGEAGVRLVKQELDLNPSTIQRKKHYKAEQVRRQKSRTHSIRQESQQNGNSNALNTVRSTYGVLDQGSSAVNGSSFASTLPSAPICRQFWKAGDYDDAQASKVLLQSGQNHLRVHPKFLHSNATSHKWAFGAIAELLDNAFDEIQNGATFVMVDKTSSPRDGSSALLIQDDGGGMDPESMRRCMSFGFSDKKSKSAIGQYGNGFKTSTMRLGADVIVFSRHIKKRALTQSVGLLSYTFLRQTGHDRIVVPMVDYEFDTSTGKLRACNSGEHFSSNLSMLLQWSPYRTEAELLKQFDDMGHHGTKVIIYNLWFNDDGDLELDFESDAEDILISGAPNKNQATNHQKMLSQQHIANRFHYSLRVYSSILYLRVPERFRIILRGQVVEHHNIVNDLKFREFILYKPHIGVNMEAAVVTTIGFLKDAPHVNIHGFSVYHRNRLIMPFWGVVSRTNSRGRGVSGVLEANFIEPTHNKQDFEKTTLFHKLEARLKDMTLEYWDFHCGLIGYQQLKKSSTTLNPPRAYSGLQPVTMSPSSPAIDSPRVATAGGTFHNPVVTPSQFSRPGESIFGNHQTRESGLPIKRKGDGHIVEPRPVKRQAGSGTNATDNRHNWETQPSNGTDKQSQDQEAISLIQENKKLRAQCEEYEKSEEELNLKVQQLRVELVEVRHEYTRLLAESKLMDSIKDEKM